MEGEYRFYTRIRRETQRRREVGRQAKTAKNDEKQRKTPPATVFRRPLYPSFFPTPRPPTPKSPTKPLPIAFPVLVSSKLSFLLSRWTISDAKAITDAKARVRIFRFFFFDDDDDRGCSKGERDGGTVFASRPRRKKNEKNNHDFLISVAFKPLLETSRPFAQRSNSSLFFVFLVVNENGRSLFRGEERR